MTLSNINPQPHACKQKQAERGLTVPIWTEDIIILEILEPAAIITHAQITDVYLLGLTLHKRGKLATLGPRIPVDAVRNGRKALELIIPK